jgi:hypothetical protein
VSSGTGHASQKIMRRHALLGTCVLSFFVATPASTFAVLEAYDGFDYSPVGSDLQGNGGSGFLGPWTAGGFNASTHDNYDIAAGSLTFGSLAVEGNSVSTSAQGAIAGLTRNLATPLGADNTTAYLSVLLQPDGTLNDGAFNGFFGVLFENAVEPEVFLGKPGGGAINTYVIENRGGANQYDSGVAATVGQTAFLVVKAEFLPGNDIFTLYLNPTPGAPEPALGLQKSDADNGVVSGITIYSTGAFTLDELRVGSTWADVTPVSASSVPDSGVGLIGAALAFGSALIGRRNVRKS